MCRVTRDFSKRDVSTWRGKKECVRARERERERKEEKRFGLDPDGPARRYLLIFIAARNVYGLP